MKRTMTYAALAALSLAACQPKADAPVEPQAAAPEPEPAREIAFIANAEGATVSLLDLGLRAIVATIDINPDKRVVDRPGTPNYAQDSDVSPDGKTLYVSRGYMGDVAAFDIASGKPLWVRNLETGRADHMTITADGKWLFVSVMFDNQVEKIDAATGEGKGRFPSGVYPHDNQISKDGKSVYNTSLGQVGALPAGAVPKVKPATAMQFTVADLETLAVTRTIVTNPGIRPWHMNADESVIYAQMSNLHGVVAIAYPSGKEIKRLNLPVKDGVTEADWDFQATHHGLALSHDGTTLCLAGRASDYAALVKAPELELIATIPVADAPGWSALAQNDQTCIIVSTRADTISLISMPDRAEVARIEAGNGPKHITVAQIPGDIVDAAIASSAKPATP